MSYGNSTGMTPSTLKRYWKLGIREFNTEFFDITPKGELMVKEGHYQYNIYELAKKYGSPVEIMFPSIIESRIRTVLDYFNAHMKLNDYRGKFYYHYPMKVNQNKEFVLPLISEGAHLETSSANELWIVMRLWEQGKFNAKIRVLCNGPKTQRYLTLIEELHQKGLTIIPIIEADQELDFFKKYRGEVGVRVDMNIKIKSHWDKRYNHFGFPEEALLKIGKIHNLGMLSYHISSQIERVEDFVAPIKRVMALYARMREKNPQLDTINIGGGAGVAYEKKTFYSPKTLINRVVKAFKYYAQYHQTREPNIVCEWGRLVTAPAQITVYKVIGQKPVDTSQAKHWYVVDGSFINDLSDTWAIHQRWHVIPVNMMHHRKLQRVWLAGISCDSDDKYTSGGGYILLPRIDNGEDLFVAMLDTGAYQDSLASHHCLLSSPAKLVVHNGVVTLARRRETPEEIGRLFGW